MNFSLKTATRPMLIEIATKDSQSEYAALCQVGPPLMAAVVPLAVATITSASQARKPRTMPPISHRLPVR